MGRRKKDADEQERRAREVAGMFDEAPMKRQKTLPFTPSAPADRAAAAEADHIAHKEAVATKQAARAELAAAWGLPWPEPSTPSRKGGPAPKAAKWKAGMYKWWCRGAR